MCTARPYVRARAGRREVGREDVAPGSVRRRAPATLPPVRVAASEQRGSAMAGIALVAVIILWGLGPPVTKLVTAPALVAVTIRLWASVPILVALVYATGGRISWNLLRRTWL